MARKMQSKTRKKNMQRLSGSMGSENKVNIGAERKHGTKILKNSTSKISSSSPVIKRIQPLDDQNMPSLEEMI
jgi:hypothetical protein